jgi:hypothetical protein
VADAAWRGGIWTAALRDAAGLFAAYFAGAEFGPADLGRLAARGAGEDDADPFLAEIDRLLEVGRAWAILEIAERHTGAVSTSYRHQILYCKDLVRGRVHVPRYLAMRARGPEAGVPVVRAERQEVTPENLLFAEAIRRSLVVTREFPERAPSGAVARLTRDLHHRLLLVEARHPWSHLRTQPRPPLRSLLQSVRARVRAGAVPAQPISRIADLLDPGHPSPTSFEYGAELFSLVATARPEFEDRLFELLCLAWLLEALRLLAADAGSTPPAVHPGRVRGGGGRPVVEATVGRARVDVVFQSGGAFPDRHWRYAPGERLRAIFDVSVRITTDTGAADVILDAKNRSIAQESEVIYKMLGYKENVHARGTAYRAVAIFPRFNGTPSVRTLVRTDDPGVTHTLWIAHVPLGEGKAVFGRAVRLLLRRIGR